MDEKVIDEVEATEQQRAILFELENVAVEGRKVVYDVVKKLMTAKKVDMKPHMYSRYGVNASVHSFISTVLEQQDKTRLSEEKLSEEVISGIKTAMGKSDRKLDAGLKTLIEKATGKGVVVGAITELDDATAKGLVSNLKIDGSLTNVLSCSSDGKAAPSADAWLKLAKNIDIPPQLCVVVTTSSASCKAALSAGMRSCVVPDEFTTFEDFGGADFIVEAIDDKIVDDLLTLLESC